MKWSKFNYMFKSEKFGYLLYNSLTNSFADITKTTYNEFLKIKKDPENYDFDKKLGKETINSLKNNLILIENNDDELTELKMNRNIVAMSKDFLSLTIAPTSDCNFNCPYCFEKHTPIYMNEKTEDKIIKFIKKYRNIRALYLTWYGGEPLLAYETIKSLTKKIKDLNIKFFADMITNGYLLNKDIINELSSLSIDKLQITIDGPEDIHNKKRPHIKNNNSYEKIIENIDLLFNSNWKGYINIRVNVDNNNIKYFPEIYNYFKEKYSSRFTKEKSIGVYASPISNISETCVSAGGCIGALDISKFDIELFEKYGVNSADLYPDNNISGCTATRLSAYVIGPNGELYKCWNDVGKKEMIVGSVYTEKKPNTQLLSKYLIGTDPFDDEKCKNCFFLPICMGGCAYSRLMNKYHNKNINTCIKFKYDLKSYLEAHYERKQKIS